MLSRRVDYGSSGHRVQSPTSFSASSMQLPVSLVQSAGMP